MAGEQDDQGRQPHRRRRFYIWSKGRIGGGYSYQEGTGESEGHIRPLARQAMVEVCSAHHSAPALVGRLEYAYLELPRDTEMLLES